MCAHVCIWLSCSFLLISLFVCFALFWFVCLFACLFSKKREKEAMVLNGWVGLEGLKENERAEALIRIYNMQKGYF